MSFSTAPILLALGCSTFIGVAFGFMPARRAAMLNPIEALSRD
jgi:macrolide transport system ATP-binding/permease protein